MLLAIIVLKSVLNYDLKSRSPLPTAKKCCNLLDDSNCNDECVIEVKYNKELNIEAHLLH